MSAPAQYGHNVRIVYFGYSGPMTGTLKTLSYRNSDGELVDVPTVAATRFKNEFGAIFEQAALGGAVAITKHNTPKAVLLSYAEFEALTKAGSPVLDELTDEFDELLAGMQTTASKSAMAAAFDATPKELGRAAVSAARRPRR
jgi:antitoxin Phd